MREKTLKTQFSHFSGARIKILKPVVEPVSQSFKSGSGFGQNHRFSDRFRLTGRTLGAIFTPETPSQLSSVVGAYVSSF